MSMSLSDLPFLYDTLMEVFCRLFSAVADFGSSVFVLSFLPLDDMSSQKA